MNISALLEVEKGVTALIGGGGKTTLMYTLAEELRRRGIKRILSSDCHSRENLLFGFEEYAPWLD